MSKKPKPPIGFVPVDSEEAKRIADDTIVNVLCLDMDIWTTIHCSKMNVVRRMHGAIPSFHYHVQLPPPVEWEEVWEWGVDAEGPYLLRNGKGFNWNDLGYSFMDTIVRALNEMENKNE